MGEYFCILRNYVFLNDDFNIIDNFNSIQDDDNDSDIVITYINGLHDKFHGGNNDYTIIDDDNENKFIDNNDDIFVDNNVRKKPDDDNYDTKITMVNVESK